MVAVPCADRRVDLPIRQMQGAGGKALRFGKAAREAGHRGARRVTFEDVAGVDEAKEELQEIVEFLKDPRNSSAWAAESRAACCWSARPAPARRCWPRRSPAKPTCRSSASAARTSSRCSSASAPAACATCSSRRKKNAPCIIFIDEIDAVGRHRGAGLGGGNDEREQTLNQLLVEMDGFETNEGVIVIAATNRPDVLDPALLRPGRFDRQVQSSESATWSAASGILKVHARKVTLAPDVDLEPRARHAGFSGADLANLVNEAALLAARRNKRIVSRVELEDAKDKVCWAPSAAAAGHDRRGEDVDRLSRSRPRRRRAQRQGHRPAAQGHHHPARPSLGMVMQLPERDKLSMSLEQMTSQLAIMMGGRVAEELVFGREKVHLGRRLRHRAGHQACAHDGDALGLVQ